jgi:hypothetical protein
MLAGAWIFKENMLYAVVACVMGISMVIAAWGEGVNVCLCPPSPSSDQLVVRLERALKIPLAGVLGRAPTHCTCPRAQSVKEDRNIVADL